MLILVFRVLIVYLVILLFLRIMGKRQLGQMQPFELVITLIIADIATLPMTQTSMPVLYSLVPLLSIVLLHFLVSIIARKSIVARRILNGKPVIVISPNGIEYQNLKALNMNFDDLMQGLRICNYHKIEDVAYAIVETNGQISVIAKSECLPVANADMKIQLAKSSLPLNIITAGKIINENIKLAGIDIQFVQRIIKKSKLNSTKEVLLLTLDSNGKVVVFPYNQKPVQFNINFKGETL